MGIYRVRIYGKIRAELEITADGTIICTASGGPTNYFTAPLRDLAFAEQVSHDTVLLNFFHGSDTDSLVQVSMTSENCASMMDEIVSAASLSTPSPVETKGPAAPDDG